MFKIRTFRVFPQFFIELSVTFIISICVVHFHL